MQIYLILVVVALALGSPTPRPASEHGSAEMPKDAELQEGRIVGGDYYDIEFAPYQVSLRKDGKSVCGGAIISPTIVLTAAHCLMYGDPTRIIVNAGTDDSRVPQSLHTVDFAIPHAGFNMGVTGNPRHDIAILVVSPPFKFGRKIRSIPLATTRVSEGQLVTITGYGLIREGGQTSQFLKGVTVPVYNKNKCSRAYYWMLRGKVRDEFFCAGYPEGKKDACQGDSGGPVTSNGKLVGIVSFGDGCARPNSPGMYTEVAYYNSWLKGFLSKPTEEDEISII